jgi:hypothetical protein
MLPAATLLVATLLAATIASGCGSGGATRKSGMKSTTADQVAFYQLATIIGTMRLAPLDVPDLRRRLRSLAPRDPGLRELRDQLATALARTAPKRLRSDRPALTAAANAAYLGLLSYQRRHPTVRGLVPD